VTAGYKSFVLAVGYVCTLTEIYILVRFLCLSLRQPNIERTMDLTEKQISFGLASTNYLVLISTTA